MAAVSFENLKPDILKKMSASNLDSETQTALKFVSEGKDVPTKITKSILVRAIHFLLDEFDCKIIPTEENSSAKSVVKPSEGKSGDEDLQQEGDQNVPSHSNASSVVKVCRYFRSGNCQHGISGKTVVNGRTCTRAHPKVCINSKKNGFCKERKTCKFLHLSVCREYMRKGQCSYDEKCRFYHPKNITPANNVNRGSEVKNTGNSIQESEKTSTIRREAGPELGSRSHATSAAEASFLEQQTNIMFKVLEAKMLEAMQGMFSKMQCLNNNNIPNNRMWGPNQSQAIGVGPY